LSEQDHEAIFEARLYWDKVRDVFRELGVFNDHAHRAAFGHRIND
jgi:hypothetical protein